MDGNEQLKQNGRNELTEHSINYRLINPNLLQCYAALSPATMVKLSICLFQTFIKSKKYDADELEQRRIYMNEPITADFILYECYPGKYQVDNRDPKIDYSNLAKALKKIDEMNVFYMWAYKTRPSTKMIFIIERDIGIWKFYNPNACVPPKTIMKILNCAPGMMDSMERAVQESERPSIERSMCKFLSGMILKMHPSISSKIARYNGERVDEYIERLLKEIAKLDNFEGLSEHETFTKNIPVSISSLLIEKRSQAEKVPSGQAKTREEVMSAIIPNDADLVRKKVQKVKSKPVQVKADFIPFKEVHPFDDVNSFIKFYRACVRQIHSNAMFYGPETERNAAAKILDTLIDEGLSGNERFLKGWICHYARTHLRGSNAKNRDKTTLKAFADTLKMYRMRYVPSEHE